MDQVLENAVELFKKIEENEKKNQSIKPFLRPGSKSFFEHDFRIRMFNNNSNKNKKTIELKQTYTCIKKHTSYKKWEDFKKITLKEMYVNKVHEGRYLEGKVAYEPFFITAIQSLIQDENGDLEVFSVYNLNRNYDEDPKLLLPLGATVRIKEPFLKMAASGNGMFSVRVDSPSDLEIVILTEIPKSIQDNSILYEKFNKDGNEFFSQKKFLQAIRSYTKALTFKDCVKSYSNRALAYLKLECFQSAFLDAEKSVHLEPNEKGYFRLGLSLYNMRQFEKSLEQFEKCLELNSKNKEAKQEIKKCHERIQETKGIYDFSYLIRNSGKDNLRIDVADYVSDKIEIIDIPKKGKGVIAKVDIPKNTLLVGSKALSISYDCEFLSRYALIAYNLLNRTVDKNSQCLNLLNLIYKMRNDPFLSEQVYKLYGGNNFDRDQKINPSIIDTERIENIQTFNAFKAEDFRFIHEKNFDSSGVWYYPSYFNHSCLENCMRIYFSDFVIIYTGRDIKQGEELTVSYFPLESIEEREKISKQFGFKCTCEICEMDRKDSVFNKKRQEILKDIDKVKDNFDSKKIASLVEKVRNTYKQRHKYKYDLIKPIGYLGNKLLQEGKVDEGLKCYIEIFDLAKESGYHYIAIRTAIIIADSYQATFRLNEAKIWRKKAHDYFPFDPNFKDYLKVSQSFF
ncbi:unnamed protein product [Brachionus calyciflorus]|uniref:SET domain-containing protein n=1 Tax=Brachionus calyciflorus TaxID=104777 RepID=A0A813RA73_9BILA|nr:unnamed protein product [Brachionus calyciflorus]